MIMIEGEYGVFRVKHRHMDDYGAYSKIIIHYISFRSLMPWSGRSHMGLKLKANLLNFYPELEK